VVLAREELHADRRFELLDARRDVGRNAMQSPRRPHDAAFADDGAEDVKVGKLHRCASLNTFSKQEHYILTNSVYVMDLER